MDSINVTNIWKKLMYLLYDSGKNTNLKVPSSTHVLMINEYYV
jgi:hypothetical protein